MNKLPPLISCLRAAGLAALLAAAGTSHSATHRYITTSGVTVEADQAWITADQIILRRTDGKFFTVAASKLSPDDLRQAKTQAASSAPLAAAPAPVAPAPKPVVAATPTPSPFTPKPAAPSAEALKPLTAAAQPYRLDIRVNSGKSQRVSKSYQDDSVVELDFSVDVTNREVNRSLDGAQATLIVVGKSVVDSKECIILGQESWPLSVLQQKTIRLTGKTIRTVFDNKNSVQNGYRYRGYLFAIKDSSGAYQHTSAAPAGADKYLPQALAMKVGDVCDEQFKPRASSTFLRD
jgi:hypothetical protein